MALLTAYVALASASGSVKDSVQEVDGSDPSPATNSAAKATKQRESPEGASKSSTADEIIHSMAVLMPPKHTQRALPMKTKAMANCSNCSTCLAASSANVCRKGEREAVCVHCPCGIPLCAQEQQLTPTSRAWWSPVGCLLVTSAKAGSTNLPPRRRDAMDGQ